MEHILVRYKVKPDRIDQNTRYIEALLAELKAKNPQGLRYLALRLDDGTFVHFASVEEGGFRVSDLEAFKDYHAQLHERLLDEPQPCDAVIIGDYGMLAQEAPV